MELKITDYLRIIADLCLNRENAESRIENAERIVHKIQRQLNIPEEYEAAVAILSVLFSVCSINGRIPFKRFKMKMGLNEITVVQEDFVYLLNNQYIELGKYANSIEWIKITSKLYNQIWHDMKQENHKLFMLLAGRELNEPQLKFLKSQLFNDGLDIAELFKMAVVCRQFEAAQSIIDFGFDMNKEYEIMAYELFICSQMKSSKFCIDFYLKQGLKITDTLLNEIMKHAEDNRNDFEIEKAIELIDELRHYVSNN